VEATFEHEFVGHHTCSNKNGKAFVEKNAPFRAVHDQEGGSHQFLGSGYYFWDDNEDVAHHWGNMHYRGAYFVLAARISTPNILLLDLVGNRQDMKYLRDVVEMFRDEIFPNKEPAIGSVLEFLQKINGQEGYAGIFPFKVIRAVDSSSNNPKFQSPMKFVGTKSNFTMLNPRIIICLIEKKSGFLHSKQLI
jgi:hypothetical protein